MTTPRPERPSDPVQARAGLADTHVEQLLRRTYQATAVGPATPDRPAVTAAPRGRGSRRRGALVGGLAAAAAITAVIVPLFTAVHQRGAVAVAPTLSPAAASTPATPATRTPAPAIPTSAVWLVAGWGSGPLVVIDPGTGTVLAGLDLDGASLQKTLPAFGKVWVSVGQPGTLLRLDPTSGTVEQRLPLGSSAYGLAADDHLLWVAVDNTVLGLDPATGAVVGTVTVPVQRGGPGELVYDGSSLWLSMSEDDQVWRIDPRTATVTARVAVGHTPEHLAFDGRWVWVGNGRDNTLSRIDPRSATVTATVRLGPADPATWVGSPTAMVRVGTRLWVVHAGGANGTHLSRIDGTTATLLDANWPCCTASAVTDGRHVWFGSSASGTQVIAVDTTTLASVSVFSRPYPTPS